MIVFLDFDDTLFNTRDFIRDFESIFTRRGIASDVYRKTHQSAYHLMEDGGSVYDVELHLQNVWTQDNDFDIDAVRQEVASFLENTSHYVFSDMRPFLKKAQEKNIHVYVLSFGQSDFQNKKIAGTGLGDYFEDVFVIQEKKDASIAAVMEKGIPEAVWFFDDRAEYIRDVKQAIPEVKTVQVSRPEGRYHDARSSSADFLIPDFSAIVEVFSA